MKCSLNLSFLKEADSVPKRIVDKFRNLECQRFRVTVDDISSDGCHVVTLTNLYDENVNDEFENLCEEAQNEVSFSWPQKDPAEEKFKRKGFRKVQIVSYKDPSSIYVQTVELVSQNLDSY